MATPLRLLLFYTAPGAPVIMPLATAGHDSAPARR